MSLTISTTPAKGSAKSGAPATGNTFAKSSVPTKSAPQTTVAHNAPRATAAPTPSPHYDTMREREDRRRQEQRTSDSDNALSRMADAITARAERHKKATTYGAIGIGAAVLILLIGFWPTVLIALFAGIGIAIGSYADGDRAIRSFATKALHQIKG